MTASPENPEPTDPSDSDFAKAIEELEQIKLAIRKSTHEFNNLLTVVFGYTEMLRKGSTLSEEQQEELEGIRRAVTRAREVTGQLRKAAALERPSEQSK